MILVATGNASWNFRLNSRCELIPLPQLEKNSQSVSGNEKGGLRFLRNHERLTAIPVVTRVEPQVSYRNLRNPTRFHLQSKMMPDSPALCAEQLCFPHQTKRRLLFLYGSPECPQEHRHKSRGTPRSLLELERAPCTPNHLKIWADSHSSIGEESRCSTLIGSAALSHMQKIEKNPEVPAVS